MSLAIWKEDEWLTLTLLNMEIDLYKSYSLDNLSKKDEAKIMIKSMQDNLILYQEIRSELTNANT